MKRNITLALFILVLGTLPMLAAAPTVPASNMTFTGLDGSSFTISFTRGNGANRIVVVKEGSAITGTPVNGVEYTANSNFSTPGSEFTQAGEFVVYKGNFNSVTVNKLKPGTTYHISVFEYNGTGASAEYLSIPLNASQATVSTPTTQAAITSFTSITGNSVTVNWTNGNGSKRMILARKGAPVNASPEDLKSYVASSDFGAGNVLNGDNYVVFSSPNNLKTTVTNLEPNTTYHFAIFELNGNSSPMYLRPGGVSSVTTHTGPTQASSNINFSDIEGSQLTMSFGKGNGSHQLIIVRKNQPVTAVPVNGVTYTANTAFGQGTEIAPGEFVVNTLLDSRTFSNFEPYTTYHFRIYDFDVTSGGQTYYFTGASAQKSQSTAVAPTTQASGINFTNVTGNAATLRFTQGNGGYRLSVIREGAPVDGLPTDLTYYNSNGVFGSGQQVSAGNYAIGNSNGTTVNITNLTPGKTYHVAVFEYNGNNYPVYMKPGATASISLPAQPTQASTAFYTNNVEGNAFRANWTGGNGSRRVVFARKGAAVTARPADGATYTANASFGAGEQVAPGEFVVYDGAFNNVNVENLEIGATYHFAVFEYNPSSTGPDYLTSAFLAASGTTLSAPTTQAVINNVTNVQSTQATFNFTKGNGSGRIFIMRENAPVNADPQDLIVYNSNTIFGTQPIGTGNYVVLRTTGTAAFTVTALSPATTYHVAVLEYNGITGPAYMRPAGTFSFTTAAGTGVTAPTVPASNGSVTHVDGNRLRLSWTNGNGSSRIVVARQGSAVNFTPANGTVYTQNAAFGAGTDLGNGQFVVYSGNSTLVSVTNLLPSTSYHFAVFEFNGTGSETRYLTSSFLAGNGSTATPPATPSSNANAAAGATSVTLTWNTGSGNGRLVVMRDGSAVTAVPSNLSLYPASAVFGNGAQVSAGQYAVYSGASNQVVVTGLSPNKTYHFTIFEFNGEEAPVYNTATVLNGTAVTSSTLPVKWVFFTAKESNSNVVLDWATANEVNAAQYVIERSINNTQYVALDSVQAKRHAGNNNYSYTDRSRPAGAAYYRIRQADADGRYAFSKVLRVEADGKKSSLAIFPNPVQDVCRVSLPQGMQQATLLVFDMKGTQVRTLQVSNGELININNLPAGTYHAVVRSATEQFSTRIIKR